MSFSFKNLRLLSSFSMALALATAPQTLYGSAASGGNTSIKDEKQEQINKLLPLISKSFSGRFGEADRAEVSKQLESLSVEQLKTFLQEVNKLFQAGFYKRDVLNIIKAVKPASIEKIKTIAQYTDQLVTDVILKDLSPFQNPGIYLYRAQIIETLSSLSNEQIVKRSKIILQQAEKVFSSEN